MRSPSNRESERGVVTIEATISLCAFLFLFMTMYSVITVCNTQARMAVALDNTAKELSQYTYLYSLTGLQEKYVELQKKAEEAANGATGAIEEIGGITSNVNNYVTNIASGISSLQSLFGGKGKGEIPDTTSAMQEINVLLANIKSGKGVTKETLEKLKSLFSTLAEDPMAMITGMVSIIAHDGISVVASYVIAPPICKALIKKHVVLSGDDKSDAAVESSLKKMNILPDENGSYIDGLNFSKSSIYTTENYDIVLRMEYDVNLTPYLPVDITFHICQSAATRGWADGDKATLAPST